MEDTRIKNCINVGQRQREEDRKALLAVLALLAFIFAIGVILAGKDLGWFE